MKKLSLITLVRTLTVMSGSLLVMLLACMIPLARQTLHCFLIIAAVLFFAVSFVELFLSRKLRKGETERPDERDIQLMQRAADTAITINKPVLCALAILFLVIWSTADITPFSAILFAFVGMHLPAFIKYCFFLHYERIDEGEYGE